MPDEILGFTPLDPNVNEIDDFENEDVVVVSRRSQPGALLVGKFSTLVENVKSVLKTYFDTLYASVSHVHASATTSAAGFMTGDMVTALDTLTAKAVTPTLIHNGQMRINQKKGYIDRIGRYSILPHPFRFDTRTPPLRRPDRSWEHMSFYRGICLDRWMVYLDRTQAVAVGFVEQVRLLDALPYTSGMAIQEGKIYVAPSGGFGHNEGPYVYRALRSFTATNTGNLVNDWNTDVKTATVPTSFDLSPRNFAIYGLYETDPMMQGKFAMRIVMLTGAGSTAAIEQDIEKTLVGQHTLGFAAKVASGTLALTPVVQGIYGLGQTGTSISSSALTVTTTAQRFTRTLTIPAPTQSYSGYTENNRRERTNVRLSIPTGVTFDLRITDIDFGPGAQDRFSRPSLPEDMANCERYFWSSGGGFVPARSSSYVSDSPGGVPSFNTVDVQSIYDVDGIVKADTIDPVTGRAYPNNEREITGRGYYKGFNDHRQKAHPMLSGVRWPRMMVPPQVNIYDTISGFEGYVVMNNRRQADLVYAPGVPALNYAQRGVMVAGLFNSADTGVVVQSQNPEPNDEYEEFSSTFRYPAGQDMVGSGYQTLFAGHQHNWDWIAAGIGTNVYYLVDASTQYYKNGAGSLITRPAFASGTFAVGDQVSVGAYRYYECRVAGTYTTAPDDNTIGWRAIGRPTFSLDIKMDGVIKTRADIADPATMAAGKWCFGDYNSLGFRTHYVRMASGAADPGSAPGRVTMRSNDGIPGLYEQFYFHVTADANPLILAAGP